MHEHAYVIDGHSSADDGPPEVVILGVVMQSGGFGAFVLCKVIDEFRHALVPQEVSAGSFIVLSSDLLRDQEYWDIIHDQFGGE